MQLYLVTNRKLAAGGDLLNVIDSAVEGGIDAVILREKDLSDDDLLPMALRIKKMIANRKTAMIIHSSMEVARAVQADGYHTNYLDFMQAGLRFKGLNGVSVHSLDEARQAAQRGAGYLLVSHIFATDCKPDLKPKGVDLIKEIKRKIEIPVIALGGIKPGNCRQVLEAGADGAAVMSYVMQADDPGRAVRLLKSQL